MSSTIKFITTPPKIEVETLEKRSRSGGFLNVDSRLLSFTYPDGTQRDMVVDSVDRKLADAVVVIAYFIENKKPHVYLRSALRPALAIRDYSKSGRPESSFVANQWELPAGLVEDREGGEEGLLIAAIRETHEELGFTLQTTELNKLGGKIFSCPGLIAERIYFYDVEVEPTYRSMPFEDGSPLEHGGIVEIFSLEDALINVENGLISDAKTEIGLMRFAKVWENYYSKTKVYR